MGAKLENIVLQLQHVKFREFLEKFPCIVPLLKEDNYYTPWVNQIVVVKKSEKTRLSIDYSQLNKLVLRSYLIGTILENC